MSIREDAIRIADGVEDAWSDEQLALIATMTADDPTSHVVAQALGIDITDEHWDVVRTILRDRRVHVDPFDGFPRHE